MTVKKLKDKLDDYGDHVEVAVEDHRGLTFLITQVEDRLEGSSEGFSGVILVAGEKF